MDGVVVEMDAGEGLDFFRCELQLLLHTSASVLLVCVTTCRFCFWWGDETAKLKKTGSSCVQGHAPQQAAMACCSANLKHI